MAVETLPSDPVALHALRLQQLEERETEVVKAEEEKTLPEKGIPGGILLDNVRDDVLRLMRDNPDLKEALGDIEPEEYLRYFDFKYRTVDDDPGESAFVCPINFERILVPVELGCRKTGCRGIFSHSTIETWKNTRREFAGSNPGSIFGQMQNFFESFRDQSQIEKTCPLCRKPIEELTYSYSTEKGMIAAARSIINEVGEGIAETRAPRVDAVEEREAPQERPGVVSSEESQRIEAEEILRLLQEEFNNQTRKMNEQEEKLYDQAEIIRRYEQRLSIMLVPNCERAIIEDGYRRIDLQVVSA